MESLLGDDCDFDSYSSQRLKRFPSFHHGSPLTVFPQKHIVDLLNGDGIVAEIKLFKQVKLRALSLCRHLNHRERFTYDASVFYSAILNLSKDRGSSEQNPVSGVLYSALSVCSREVLTDLVTVSQSHPGVGDLTSLLHMSPQDILSISTEIGSCFKLYRTLCRARNHIQQAHISGAGDTGELVQTLGPYSCYAVNELLILFHVYDSSEPVLIINYDQLLMLTDTIACRLMCRLACSINDRTKKDDLPSQDVLLKIYGWGDQLITTYGMRGYALIGEFESIVTSSFVNFPGSDPLRLGEPFFESILDTARELEQAHGIHVSHTVSLIDLLSAIVSPNQLSEIFGIRKHWGNPIVDAKASGRAVQEKVHEVLPVDGPSVIKLQASFNRLITLEYIRKNGKWPDCVFSDEMKDCLLYRCWKNKITRIPESSPNHNHYHWTYMRFMPNCILDSYKDQLSLLSDKSVSFYRPNLIYMYVRALVDRKLLTKEPEENRRLMLEFLRKPHLPVLSVLKKVMRNDIPFEWLSNSCAMKGTEMKYLKARIFAVLTFELRQYFAVSEDIIKEHIFRYNPHQTMTMNEITLLDKLREITKQLQSQVTSKTLNVIHIIDFSKWNLRMRYENTCTVFKSIDDFLGTPGLIERTHLIFESLINVVQDAFNPPDTNLEHTFSDTVWKFHSCGWEGQRQKGWTVITSALLSYIELLTDVSSEICGQGDNQVLLTKFPIPTKYVSSQDWINSEPDEVRRMLDNYYECLERECGKVGLKVKTAESCRSLCYLNYGKRLYFNGVELSMSLKRIGKMLTEPNESYPTTEARLKTMEGSIYAAGLYGHPGMLPYFMSRLGVYLNLDEAYRFNPLIGSSALDFISGSNCRVDSKFLSLIMRIPPSLGGPPQQFLPSYLCRGHPDPLCTDLVLLSLRSDRGDEFSRRLITVVHKGLVFRKKKDSKDSLIAAPYSLNLDITMSAKKPLERKVLEAVEIFCKNPQIKGLFSKSMSSMSQSLIDNLSTMVPFHPLVANDIFGRSPPGRRQAFLAGLSNSTSLGRLVYDNNLKPVISTVCDLERRQLLFWFEYQRAIQKVVADVSLLPLRHDQLAQHFRDLSWGCQVEGVTVPHPLGQFKLCKSDYDVCSQECQDSQPEHIVCVQHSEDLISLSSSSEHKILLSRSCEGSPYLGNVINEGLTQKEMHCDTPETPLLDAVRLNVIRRWITTNGSKMDDFLQTIISSRTDTPLDILDRISGRPSRLSFSHRAALLGTIRSSAHCSTSNMHTRFYLSSNRMGEFSHGEMNYHLPFGPAFLILQGLLCWRSINCPNQVYDMSNKRLIFHFHIRNRDVPPVYDGQLELTRSTLRLPTNIPVLLYSRMSTLEFTDLTGKSRSPLWTRYEDASVRECKLLYASQLIGNGFVNEIVHHELATTETAQQYPPRLSQISIGDVSLVGPILFCESLANHVILFAPSSIFLAESQSIFEALVFRFLSNFSRKFWNSIAGPMSFYRNLQILSKSCPHLVNYSSTKTTQGVVDIIQTVISQQTWKLWKNLRDCVLHSLPRPLLLLSAPSISALRTITSRYMELCVYSFFNSCSLPPHEIVALGRDLVANLHACSLDDFPSAYRLCQEYFRQMSISVLKRDYRLMPNPIMFYLQQPWIDRIRGSTVEPAHRTVCAHEERYMLKKNFSHEMSYPLPEYPIWVNQEACKCPTPPRSYALHWECYFQLTGTLSKSSYKFLELILSYNLPVAGVICLGTSTGSEAAAITRLKENETVYVNCFHKISSFAPHAAATYIPPSFLGEGDASKLVAPSSSVLSTNDLTDLDCIDSILSQIQGGKYYGVTCDAEIPDAISDEMFRKILRNTLVLCEHLPECEWMIIKLPIKCPHSMQIFLSDIAQLFLQCHVVYSSFNRQKARNFHFVAQKRRPMLLPTMSRVDDVILTLSDYDNWIRVLSSIDNQAYPVCLGIEHRSMLTKVQACNVAPSSFGAACFRYIQGWGDSYDASTTVYEVIRDLTQLGGLIHDALIRMLMITYRALSGIPMIRAGILEKSDTPAQRKINEMCYVYLRAALLVRLLKKDSRDFNEINDFVFNYLGKNHKVKLKNSELNVSLDQSKFVSQHSRYLFEILGHLYKCSKINVISDSLPIIHRPRFLTRVVETDPKVFLDVNYTDIRAGADHSWKWLKRCFVLSLFLIRFEGFGPLSGYCRYNHIVTTPAAVRLGLDQFYNPLQEITESRYIWIESRQQLLRTKFKLPVWLVYDNNLYRDVREKYQISLTRALPWSGVVPSKILSLCVLGQPDPSACRFVDVVDISRRAHRSGTSFAGCSCYSCTAEVMLMTSFNQSSADLDVLCSGLHLTNVLYKYHSSTD